MTSSNAQFSVTTPMANHLRSVAQAIIPVLIAGAFISLLLRFYVRTRIVRKFGWEDGFMILAFAGQIMFATCIIASVQWGAGEHLSDIPIDKSIIALKWLWVSLIGYGIAIIAVRISVALVLLRFIVQPVQKWIIYITVGCNVVTGFIVIFVDLFECKPVSYAWNPYQTGPCNVSKPVVLGSMAASVIAVLCDFSLAIVPIVLVWNVNFSKRTKLALLPIFGLACCASIGAIVEIYYFLHLSPSDFTYGIMHVAIAAHLEVALAIMAGNLVTVRPLYQQIIVKLGLRTGQRNNFKLKTPRWTHLFTSNDGNVDTAVDGKKKRQKLPQRTGESYTLVDFVNREGPKPLKQMDKLPDLEMQADGVNSADDIHPLVAQS